MANNYGSSGVTWVRYSRSSDDARQIVLALSSPCLSPCCGCLLPPAHAPRTQHGVDQEILAKPKSSTSLGHGGRGRAAQQGREEQHLPRILSQVALRCDGREL